MDDLCRWRVSARDSEVVWHYDFKQQGSMKHEPVFTNISAYIASYRITLTPR